MFICIELQLTTLFTHLNYLGPVSDQVCNILPIFLIRYCLERVGDCIEMSPVAGPPEQNGISLPFNPHIGLKIKFPEGTGHLINSILIIAWNM